MYYIYTIALSFVLGEREYTDLSVYCIQIPTVHRSRPFVTLQLLSKRL